MNITESSRLDEKYDGMRVGRSELVRLPGRVTWVHEQLA